MITIGDILNGKKKVEDPENPRDFPRSKTYNKHYVPILMAGAMVILGTANLFSFATAFWGSKSGHNRDRRDGRR
jgi:hypothetical protein